MMNEKTMDMVRRELSDADLEKVSGGVGMTFKLVYTLNGGVSGTGSLLKHESAQNDALI